MTETLNSEIVILPFLMIGMTLLPMLWITRVFRMSFIRFSALMSFIVYTAGVIHVTMFPLNLVPQNLRDDNLLSSSLNLVPFANADQTSFALNVVMMIPFGFLLPFIDRRLANLKTIALAGLATSAAIEGLQLLMLLRFGNRRIIDVDDLIANTTGAVLGYIGFLALFGVALAIVSQFRQPLPQRRITATATSAR